MKYWIGTVSKSHVLRGVGLGIAQLGHGKLAPLRRMKQGDWLVYYSPKLSLEGGEFHQAFTALGVIADDEIYQDCSAANFQPYPRRVHYLAVQDAPIKPLIEKLDFIKNKSHWGMPFRYGLIEITARDFQTIAQAMQAPLEDTDWKGDL